MPIPHDIHIYGIYASSESSRRDAFNAELFGTDTTPTAVEISSMHGKSAKKVIYRDTIINTSYQKLPFGSGDYPDKLLYHQALRRIRVCDGGCYQAID